MEQECCFLRARAGIFEAALAKDKANNDTVAVTSYDPTDSSDVARFELTEVADPTG